MMFFVAFLLPFCFCLGQKNWNNLAQHFVRFFPPGRLRQRVQIWRRDVPLCLSTLIGARGQKITHLKNTIQQKWIKISKIQFMAIDMFNMIQQNPVCWSFLSCDTFQSCRALDMGVFSWFCSSGESKSLSGAQKRNVQRWQKRFKWYGRF